MALASFNRASFKKQKPSNSPIVFKFSVRLQECSFNPFRTYTTFNHTLAFKSYYRRFKKCAKPLCILQRSFPCFLIRRQHSPLPPSLNLAVGSRQQAINPPSIIKYQIHSKFINYKSYFHILPSQRTAVGTITFFLK